MGTDFLCEILMNMIILCQRRKSLCTIPRAIVKNINLKKKVHVQAK